MQTTVKNEREIIYIEGYRPQQIKLRVAAYVRVSSDSAEQLGSFATQMAHYRKLIDEHDNWQLVEVYSDEAVSAAKTDKRTGYKQMLEDCKRGKIDRILTKSVSRFARNTQDALSAVRTLKEHGVSILFEKENIDTANLTDETILTLYATYAQEELVSISENTKRSVRTRMKEGSYVPPAVPYGYRLVDGHFITHEKEAEVVAQIFCDYLSGKGVYSIAKALRETDIPTPRSSKAWRENTVVGILKNERYKGDMLLQKSFSPDVFPLKQIKNRGEVPKYYVKNHHVGFVSGHDFDRVQEMLSYRHGGDPEYGEYTLTQKVKCSCCGSLFRRKVTRGKVYWDCQNHNRGKEHCTIAQIPEIEIETAFLRMYHRLRENSDYILNPIVSSLQALRDKEYRGNHSIEQLNMQIAKLCRQSHTLSTLVSQGVLNSAAFIAKQDELELKISNLRKEKDMYMGDMHDRMLEDTEELIGILQDGPKVLTEFDEEIFSNMVRHITAYEDRTIGIMLINGLELVEGIEKARR